MLHLVAPQSANTPDLFQTAEAWLKQSGCIARRRGERALEVWEENLREHYLLTLDTQQPPRLDITQIDGL